MTSANANSLQSLVLNKSHNSIIHSSKEASRISNSHRVTSKPLRCSPLISKSFGRAYGFVDRNQFPAPFSAELANSCSANVAVLVEDDYRVARPKTWAKNAPHRFIHGFVIVKIHNQNTYFLALPLDVRNIKFLGISV